MLWYWILAALLLMIVQCQYFSDSTQDGSIRVLVRQASRWSTAARQDQNPLIALLHANYGAAYLWALKDIATDKDIERVTGIDVIRFAKEITEEQDRANKKIIRLCPQIAPERTYLAKLGGEGT